jgi:hypothetical protein
VWKNLDHPYIHQLLGVTPDIKPGFYFMVTPWMSQGTIIDYIGSYPRGFVDLDCLVCVHTPLEIFNVFAFTE